MALVNYCQDIFPPMKDWYQKAVSDLTTAIELLPASAKAFSCRGFAYEQLGQLKEAAADLRRAFKLGRDVEDLERSLFANLAQQEFMEALADCAEMTKEIPESADGWCLYGMVYCLWSSHKQFGDRTGPGWQRDTAKNAIPKLQKADNLDPNNKSILYWLGRAYHDAGDTANALATLQQAKAAKDKGILPDDEKRDFEKRLMQLTAPTATPTTQQPKATPSTTVKTATSTPTNDFDGCGPCTKCGHIFQMYFANAVCPKCNHKMSREDAFFSCGSYPHSTPPSESKSGTTSSTTKVPSASESDVASVEQARKSALAQAMLNQYRAQTGAPAPAIAPSSPVVAPSQRSSLSNAPADWHYMKHGTRFGPYTAAQIGSMLTDNAKAWYASSDAFVAPQILTNDVLWHDSLVEWVPAIRVAAFHDILRAVIKHTGPVICAKCFSRYESLFLLKQGCVSCADEQGRNNHRECKHYLGGIEIPKKGFLFWKKRTLRPGDIACPYCNSRGSVKHFGKERLQDSLRTVRGVEEIIGSHESYTMSTTQQMRHHNERLFYGCDACYAVWYYYYSQPY